MARNHVWQQDVIQAHMAGRITDEQLADIVDRRITTRPQHRTCRDCKAVVIVALDAPTAAIVVTLDPYAITAEGEVWALRRGRRTYRLDRNALALRDRWNLPGKPPGPGRAVLAEHACGDVVPPGLRRPPAPAARPATHDKEPPF